MTLVARIGKKIALQPAMAGFIIPVSFGWGLLLSWYATAMLRTLILSKVDGISLTFAQLPAISLSLFGFELVLLLLATCLKVSIFGIPQAVSELQNGQLPIRNIFAISFLSSARKTLLAVSIATAFVAVAFTLLRPTKGQRYHQTIAAEVAIGNDAQAVFLPNRVIAISGGMKVSENARALTDGVAIGHLFWAVWLLGNCLIRLLWFLMGIDYSPSKFRWGTSSQPIPRGGGRSP